MCDMQYTVKAMYAENNWFDLMADVCATWWACQQRLLLLMGVQPLCKPAYTYCIVQQCLGAAAAAPIA